jgi:translation initiation factor 3 subunit K
MVSFDYAPDRPENIEAILNGLDRYNPETTSTFQEYVAQQCENQTYDCYGNLALLKLYVGNHLTIPYHVRPGIREGKERTYAVL